MGMFVPVRNAYSRRWFTTFLGVIDADIVAPEVAFLQRQLPRDAYPLILDLCCGPGRHAVPLADAGYTVIGIDRDARALSAARSNGAAVDAVQADMRALPVKDASVDAIICMWQSFGHFDSPTNRRVLGGMARALRPSGRLVLDLYHRAFHERTTGEREIDRGGVRVVENRRFDGNRLCVALHYAPPADDADPTESREEFEWQLYSPEELIDEADVVGLTLRVACTGFDEARPPSPDAPRMQLVFSRASS